MYNGKIGGKYSKEQLQTKYQQAKDRFNDKIPPGFLDENEKKGTEKYSDYIIWSQIIEKAKESHKPIIFVTDETYDDWWWKWDGETLGPRPELVEELYSEAGELFYMYRPEQFIKFAGIHLNQKVDSRTVREIQKISEEKKFEKTQFELPKLFENPYLYKKAIRHFIRGNDYHYDYINENFFKNTVDEKSIIDRLITSRELVKHDPDNNLPDVAQSLTDLARIHLSKQDIRLAKAEYTEALTIFQLLEENNPHRYTRKIDEIQLYLKLINAITSED